MKIEEVIGVYQKLGIPINNESTPPNWVSPPFGIYTKNGFDYSNNTSER